MSNMIYNNVSVVLLNNTFYEFVRYCFSPVACAIVVGQQARWSRECVEPGAAGAEEKAGVCA